MVQQLLYCDAPLLTDIFFVLLHAFRRLSWASCTCVRVIFYAGNCLSLFFFFGGKFELVCGWDYLFSFVFFFFFFFFFLFGTFIV